MALSEQHLGELTMQHSPPPPSRQSDTSAHLVRATPASWLCMTMPYISAAGRALAALQLVASSRSRLRISNDDSTECCWLLQVRMGFPSRTPPGAGVFAGEACGLAAGGFACPRCRALVADLPCR